MWKKYILVTILHLWIFQIQLTGQDNMSLESFILKWKTYHKTGEFDTLIAETTPFFQNSISQHDTLSAFYAAINLAQTWMIKEVYDSAKYYIDILPTLQNKRQGKDLSAALNNILGIYAQKIEGDYSKALQYFYEGYKNTLDIPDTEKSIVFLANIVHIFYVRADRNGLEYARTAYKLSEDQNTDDFSRCMAMIAMAQMLYLSCDYTLAGLFLADVDSIASAGRMRAVLSVADLVSADVHTQTGDYATAGRIYRNIIDDTVNPEPGIKALAYLHYGTLCELENRFDTANKLYKEGLSFSYSFSNMELQRQFLHKIVTTSHTIHDDTAALRASLEYFYLQDNHDYQTKEQTFNSLLLKYQQMRYESDIYAKELKLLKAEKKHSNTLFLSICISLASIFLFILYWKQRKTYKILAERYNRNLQQEEAMSSEHQSDKNADMDKNLFIEIDNLMKKEKFYRTKAVSLEMIADKLGSNTTYVSRAINKYAGTNFYGFINTYRIKDAAGQMTDPKFNLPLKELADNLGFSSVSAFYKTFHKETGCTAAVYLKETGKSLK